MEQTPAISPWSGLVAPAVCGSLLGPTLFDFREFGRPANRNGGSAPPWSGKGIWPSRGNPPGTHRPRWAWAGERIPVSPVPIPLRSTDPLRSFPFGGVCDISLRRDLASSISRALDTPTVAKAPLSYPGGPPSLVVLETSTGRKSLMVSARRMLPGGTPR